MRRAILLISIPLVIVLLFAGCSNPQKEQKASNTIDLPVVSLEGTDDKTSVAFYENDFDFNYDDLPKLTSSESSCILQISLADNFASSVQLGEDYYTYTSNTGVCGKKTYDLTKDKNGTVSLAISRRGTARDEEAIYYLKNKQGTFVFKVILPLDAKN